jgi:hypothetical protein
MRYTASKSRTQNRPGFSISFRHPLRNDSKNRPGLKVRRGLNTTDEDRADALVSQMNELLNDEAWWNTTRRQEAESRFDPIIVEAFFDDIQAGQSDSKALRDSYLPLPGKEEGYARVLFVGTTGAGKTSLLRHLIGSDPEKDRFPSTSTAKTTVSDIEVIPAHGSFRAAVTFFTEFLVQANIEDCLLNACTAVWENESDARIAERLLNHPDQRFRLTYTLGSWREESSTTTAQDDDWSFGNEMEIPTVAEDDELVSSEDSRRNQAALTAYVRRVHAISEPIIARTRADFGDPAGLSAEDASAALEIFQEQVEETSEFSDLVHDIMSDVVERFELLPAGALHRPRKSSRWPDYWTYETADRGEFIRQIRWFSSNYAQSFGRLLTPLVDGIRITGPLFPEFSAMKQKMVLLDGQGLGHTADSSASVTTHITRKYSEVDVILLVDNAEQPIQAAAQAVLRSVASSGNYGKLAIAFTHFDQVKGANLPTITEKRAHVMDSVGNYLNNLRDILSSSVVSAMAHVLEKQSFMLGGLHAANAKLPRGVVLELERLITFFSISIEPPILPEAYPIYDPTGIAFAAQKATDKFQKPWVARLNLGYHSGIASEHWTRIKALTRRIAGELDVEYDTLRPVADLVARMTEEISNFLDNPISWTRPPKSEEEAQEAISAVRRTVFSALHDVMLRRLVNNYLADWRTAYSRSGKGSAHRRAVDMKTIYESAVPIPGTVNSEPAIALLREVRGIVCNAIEASGGQLRLETTT